MDAEQATNNIPIALMTADRAAIVGVFMCILAVVSYWFGLFGSIWLATLQESTYNYTMLSCVFGTSTWIVASIISIGLAARSLQKIGSSVNPKKVRRLAIGSLVSNTVMWMFNCALLMFMIKVISELD